ncbi:hypothetical protein H1C38_01700, partial [Salmonella enterica subsp. enterica serovar Indiana]|nr:hypothetical protein [Salmonella enterica subsp. enterica serovar Indiana]MCQ3744911.1 hypothetical protein [Salmonella enterica subsp. enterica serovar Indiana]
SLKTSIKTITYLSDIGCLEIQGASLEQKGTKRIIDTRKKDDRVIAVEKPKERKIIFDWYANADKKINIVINGLRGEFSTRNK